jgi:GNAT superfamily N-acetyltransferase
MTIKLRKLSSADGPKINALYASAPDTGAISFHPVLHGDEYKSLHILKPGMVGVVAESPEYDGLVGMGLVQFDECMLMGNIVPYAYLSSLLVHPLFRRQGVASQLAQWRVKRAHEHVGERGVIFANVQSGNTGSQKTGKKWATQVMPSVLTIPIKPRARPLRLRKEFEVRPAEASEYEPFAESRNQFFKDYTFFKPETADGIETWLTELETPQPVRHCLVATDQSGNLLAGLTLFDEYHFRTLNIASMPPPMRLMNKVLQLVPADGIARSINVEDFWYAPGQLEAASYLWQTVRYQWRKDGVSFIVFVDGRAPITEIYNIRPWTIKSEADCYVKSNVTVPEESLRFPIF